MDEWRLLKRQARITRVQDAEGKEEGWLGLIGFSYHTSAEQPRGQPCRIVVRVSDPINIKSSFAANSGKWMGWICSTF
jgi:hypothetical protein